MSAEKVQWLFELLDKVSGPSAGIIGALDKLDKKLEGIDKHPPSGDAAVKAMTKIGASSDTLGDKLTSVTGTILKWGAAAATAGAGAIAATGAIALNASNFKQDTVTALETIEGTAAKAQATYAVIEKFASKIGNKDAIADAMIKIKNAGFGNERSADLLAASLDVAARGGKEGEAKQKAFLESITKINSSNKFDPGALEQLAQATGGSVKAADLLKQIGASRKMNVSSDSGLAAVKMLLETGQVKATEGINAVLAVVNKNLDGGKGLGSAAIKKGEDTLDGQMARLKSNFSSLFSDVNTGPLFTAFESLNKLLDPSTASGQKLAATFREIFGEIGGWISKTFTAENIESFATKAMKFFGDIWGAFKSVKAGFLDTLGPAIDAIKAMTATTDQASTSTFSWSAAFKAVGQVLGIVVGAIGILVGALVWVSNHIGFMKIAAVSLGVVLAPIFLGVAVASIPLIAIGAAIYGIGKAFMWVIDKLEGPINWIKKAFKDAFGFIGDMIDGVISGLKSAWESVTGLFKSDKLMTAQKSVGANAAEALAMGAQSKVAVVEKTFADIADAATLKTMKSFGIASPSKVFKYLGEMTIAGYTQGVNDNADDPSNALNAAINTKVRPDVSGGGAGGRNITFSPTINITINTDADPNAIKKSLEGTVEEQLRELFSELAEQVAA